MCSKYTAVSSAANESQLLGWRSRKVRKYVPCMRSLNELQRDFEWRRGGYFRTIEELTKDFEQRKAQRVSSVAMADPSPELSEDFEECKRHSASSVATTAPLEPTEDFEECKRQSASSVATTPSLDLPEGLEECKRHSASSVAAALSLDAAPPGLEMYSREQLLGVFAALPKELNRAAPGIRCVSRVSSLAESSRGSDGERSDCGHDSSVEGDSTPADAVGSGLRAHAADTRKGGASRLVCEEAEGCPSTTSGEEPSEGGSLDSEEPRLAEAAAWESWPAEGASWEKMPSGMRYPELWYPDWGYWDLASEQCWFVDCNNYVDPGCADCAYADVGAPTLLKDADLSPEPCWSGAHDAVYA